MDMFPGAAAGMAGMADGGAPPPADDGKILDLRDKIDSSGCYAKNVDKSYPMTNLFVGDSTLGCRSDADEQLIIHIAFKEFVKVSKAPCC